MMFALVKNGDGKFSLHDKLDWESLVANYVIKLPYKWVELSPDMYQALDITTPSVQSFLRELWRDAD